MKYVIKRLVLMVPTLFFILLVNFAIVHIAPTSPVEEQIAKITSEQHALSSQGFALTQQIHYQGKEGLSDTMIQELNTRFGFDKPVTERFWLMIRQYMQFDLGQSFFRGQPVASLIAQKLPISLAFGTLSLLMMYGLGVLLGLFKARFDGLLFDKVSAVILAIFYCLPVFLVALFLMVLLAGGRFWQIFPMQVTLPDDFVGLSLWVKTKILLYQLTLPAIASSLSGIASIAYLTKFALVNEQSSSYVLAAKARGLTTGKIFYQQMLKPAMLAVYAEMPMTVVGVLFAGNFLVEVIFGIDGLGRLGFEAVASRDYPVMFGVLYVLTLVGMLVQLVFDLWYKVLDPRISYQ